MIAVLVIGTIGMNFIERMPIVDSFYWAGAFLFFRIEFIVLNCAFAMSFWAVAKRMVKIDMLASQMRVVF